MERREALGALVAVGAGGAVLTGLSGCEKPSPESIRKMLKGAGENGAYYGLKEWAKKDEPSAKECATALTKNIKEKLLPYLNGGNLPSSDQVQAFLSSSLFTNVKPEVKQAIVLASMALDAILPIPGANTYLTEDQVSYIKAFLEGVSEGCDAFLGARNIIKPVWLK